MTASIASARQHGCDKLRLTRGDSDRMHPISCFEHIYDGPLCSSEDVHTGQLQEYSIGRPVWFKNSPSLG